MLLMRCIAVDTTVADGNGAAVLAAILVIVMTMAADVGTAVGDMIVGDETTVATGAVAAQVSRPSSAVMWPMAALCMPANSFMEPFPLIAIASQTCLRHW